MAKEPRIPQNFTGPVYGVAGNVEGDQIIKVPDRRLPVRGEPAEFPNNLNQVRTGAISFVGRERELEKLHQQLQQNERIAITAVVTGMAGVGKTELAIQYALQQNKQTYPGGICWLLVSESNIEAQLLSFARSQLGLYPPEDWSLKEQLNYCWSWWQPPGDVLIVLDDVSKYEDIQNSLPPQEQRFKVLITTRQERLTRGFKKLPLEVLDEEAALELLESFIGKSRLKAELQEGKQLCNWLERLPLGIELVGRYLEEDEDLSLAEVQQELKQARLEADALRETQPQMTAKFGVAAALELSWKRLEQKAQSLTPLPTGPGALRTGLRGKSP